LREQIGLLHTPRAGKTSGEDQERFVERNGDRTMNCYPDLPTQISMLPTPNASTGRPSRPDTDNPRGSQSGNPLKTALAMAPTPRTSDYKGASGNTVGKGRNPLTNSCMDAVENSPDGTKTGLRLQPGFVEYLMGYPLNWTSMEPETTESIG
jgi:hypothetical protein